MRANTHLPINEDEDSRTFSSLIKKPVSIIPLPIDVFITEKNQTLVQPRLLWKTGLNEMYRMR